MTAIIIILICVAILGWGGRKLISSEDDNHLYTKPQNDDDGI